MLVDLIWQLLPAATDTATASAVSASAFGAAAAGDIVPVAVPVRLEKGIPLAVAGTIVIDII